MKKVNVKEEYARRLERSIRRDLLEKERNRRTYSSFLGVGGSGREPFTLKLPEEIKRLKI